MASAAFTLCCAAKVGVNRKRVQRLWREAGLKVRQRSRRQTALGHSRNSCMLLKAEHRNHVWTYDFVADQTEDGRMLRFLSVVDEFTRESVALRVERSMGAAEVIAVLGEVIAQQGAPLLLRSDNGSEFIARAPNASSADLPNILLACIDSPLTHARRQISRWPVVRRESKMTDPARDRL